MSKQNTVPPMPTGMPSVEEVLLQSNDIPWRAKSLAGISEQKASHDVERIANQFMFCLKGRYEYTKTGVTLTAGSFYWNPKGNVHGPTRAHEETIVLEIYDGPHYPVRPSWYSNDEDAR